MDSHDNSTTDEVLHASHIKDMKALADKHVSELQAVHDKSLANEKTKSAGGLKRIQLSLRKELSDAKDKAAEDLRSERGASAKLKQSLSQNISDLEQQLQTSKTDFNKAQAANTKRYG
ncbi:hypothetical protein BKA61DRAFT_568858 [Leptodontidium sp. MPI-SDFR-AT-0119]|nr:hypothetical protein BKA61DRAFT_568858 [Leptodontidium sp. MPI-SDFR-AT-0119]